MIHIKGDFMHVNTTMLYIKDSRSKFDSQSEMFNIMYDVVDMCETKEEALALYKKNSYDVVLGDLSVEPQKAGMYKQIKDINNNQIVFVLVDPKDTKKLYGIADMGINAFELTPDQFDQALKLIGTFDPSER
jgi:DNA-binding NarL/FixJ family response regulator